MSKPSRGTGEPGPSTGSDIGPLAAESAISGTVQLPGGGDLSKVRVTFWESSGSGEVTWVPVN